MTARLRFVSVVLVLGLGVRTVRAQAPPARDTGPWDMARLKRVPKADFGPEGEVRWVGYVGEPYRGKPTTVFAYYARPKEGKGPFPAMVLVHGGGGTAFAEWAKLWAERGYVALAMDLAGHGRDGGRLAAGGPDQDDDTKFRDFHEADIRDMWTYHAVADVVLGVSLLADRPEVDRDRIGITGISWGGYLTCIVAGIDDRLKVAVPVYGCGFLGDDSAWRPRLDAMPFERRERWLKAFDPSRHLPGVTCPILFVNGTNDFAYPLGSYRKSYGSVKRAPVTLCVTVNMPHSHPDGWKPQEIGLFVDSVLAGGKPLVKLGSPSVRTGEGPTTLRADVSDAPIKSAALHFTSDDGRWQTRKWTSAPAEVSGGRVVGTIAAGTRARVAFLTVVDERGATVSTAHVGIPGSAGGIPGPND